MNHSKYAMRKLELAQHSAKQSGDLRRNLAEAFYFGEKEWVENNPINNATKG